MCSSLHERWSSTKQTFDSLQTTSKYAVIGVGISIVSAVGGALYAHRKKKQWEREQTPMLNRYWSKSYQEARNKFRSQCQKITDCKTHSLGVDPIHDLTIDLCFVAGNKSPPPQQRRHLVLHLSGTHGVEGFAGSAIQCRLLEDIANDEECYAERSYDVLFVHAINAYGMSEGRRFNRYNVDLNRNALISPTQWKAVKSRDPNLNGFETIAAAVMDSVAYRPRFPWTDLKLWFKMFSAILRFGRSFAARAIVNGQYHRATSIFYGGFQLQNELKSFFHFLTNECQNAWNINLCSAYQKVTVIDVHTGIGPKGVDSLLAPDRMYIDKLLKIPQLPLEYVRNKHRLVAHNQTENTQVTQIYSGSVGGVKNAVSEIFINEYKDDGTSLDCLALTQEFGTVPGHQVLHALILENAVYNLEAADEQIQSELKLRQQRLTDVFYLQHDTRWKYDVLQRGVSLFGCLCNR